ncbi:MAG: PaaI family thioesterase [Bacteroidetes bacterium]|nr:PaaI family thioesterase [Bacteroidota bacterium]MBU1718324.1 PaaI family thioesterase [Bacteroidota bacterium]
MREVKNPFEGIEGYECFGCAPGNQTGLRMKFWEDGDDIVCKWQPESRYQGWNDVLHGGIQTTLMDEIASWVIFVKLLTSGVTSRLDVELLKPVNVSKGTITLRARMGDMKKRLAFIPVELFDGENVLCARGTITYFVFPREYVDRTMMKIDYKQFVS